MANVEFRQDAILASVTLGLATADNDLPCPETNTGLLRPSWNCGLWDTTNTRLAI